jgi:hypothetical protein
MPNRFEARRVPGWTRRLLNPLPIGWLFPSGTPRVPYDDEFETVDSAGRQTVIDVKVDIDLVTIQIGGTINQIRVEYTPCRFGGSRPWWRCPGCHSRRGVLYEKDHRFRCRRCLGLAYRSQRTSKLDRAAERARRLHIRLGGSGRLDDRVPNVPPPGMHSRTYFAAVMEYVAARNQVSELMREMVDRRFQRIRVRDQS